MVDGTETKFEDVFQIGDRIEIDDKFGEGDQIDIQDVRLRDREVIMLITRQGMPEDADPLQVTASKDDWQRLLDTKKAFWPFRDIGPGMRFEYTKEKRFEQISI